ncbi:hypothetical protein AB0F93_00565 [Micromonospora tulbaghiae]|uniref:hypothetical protein n=1 Tax=Micromonospora tulbaghiae TaxID=479978 RepID=UPI00331E8696
MSPRPTRGRRRRAEPHPALSALDARHRLFERFGSTDDTSHLPHRSDEEAWLLADAAVQRARLNLPDQHGRPAVDGDDCLAALALRPNVQVLTDIRELQLIEHARLLGVPWSAIGRALEYQPRTARQDARARFLRLADRYPYALAANRLPPGCGTAAACNCPPDALSRIDAGCELCPHCTPTSEEPTRA